MRNHTNLHAVRCDDNGSTGFDVSCQCIPDEAARARVHALKKKKKKKMELKNIEYVVVFFKNPLTVVGSSKKMTSGLPTMAMAVLSLRLFPPLRVKSIKVNNNYNNKETTMRERVCFEHIQTCRSQRACANAWPDPGVQPCPARRR